MADTKNYGLKGVGNDVQLGKAGSRFNLSGTAIQARDVADGAFVNFKVLTPVADEDAATKLYVDNTASGLDVKESVTCASTADLGAVYNPTGGAATNGQFTGGPVAIDGVTLAEFDRVLVKNEADAKQNGIYVVTATTTTIDRATDHDSDAEVNAGNFTFVEEGTVNSDSGWVLQGPNPLTINTSDLNWVLFSTSSPIAAGVGLVKNGDAFDLDFSELTSASVIAGADELIFQDGTVESRITVTNFLADRDIVTISANGIVTRTAADTYAARTITASTAATEEGLIVTNGDGVLGNPTVGLDIQGATDSVSDAADTDSMILFDGINNREYTVSQLANAPAFDSAGTSIVVGDTSVAITDTGTDGTITTNADGATVIVTTDTGTTFTVDSATTNADIPVIRVSATSTGTPLAGIGPSIEFEAETAAGAPGNQEVGGLFALEATNVGGATEDFDFVFQLMAGGTAAAERARITSVGGVSAATFTASSLTDNRVLLAGTSGLIEDDANFTFNGTTMGITAAVDITGDLDVDNINLNLNTISNTSVDANLILLPNGTGSIIFQNGSGEEILELNDTVSAINGLAIAAGATGNPAQITTGTGSEANIDIGFLTNGTGAISVVAGTGNYEDNVTADDDIPNKKYVDDAIEAVGGSGTVDTITGSVDLTTASVQNIGAAAGIPANATILSVLLDVTTPSDAVTTVTVGDITNGAASYMTATENNPEVQDIYIANGRLLNGAGTRQATATVAVQGTVGAATCIITFRHA